MRDELFRKSSLEKISSPEQITDYIKTSGPCIWAVLAVCTLMLIGAAVWGVMGTIDISVGSVAVCENGYVTCYISENDIDEVSDKASLRIGDKVYELADISQLPIPAKDTISPYGMHLGGFSEDEWTYTANCNADIDDGVYKAEIIIKSVSPISLLMN